jgi:hypothetical protein
LSAEHDGTSNACTAEDNFIMSPGTQTSSPGSERNAWVFSNCSINYFDTYLASIEDTA